MVYNEIVEMLTIFVLHIFETFYWILNTYFIQSSRNYRKQTLDIAKSRVKGNLMSMTMATGNLLLMMNQEDDSDDNEGLSVLDDFGGPEILISPHRLWSCRCRHYNDWLQHRETDGERSPGV